MKENRDGSAAESSSESSAILSDNEGRSNRPVQSVEPPSSPRFLTCRQVAERWGCCDHTVRRRKELKPLRFNRRLLRYRLADAEAVEQAAAG